MHLSVSSQIAEFTNMHHLSVDNLCKTRWSAYRKTSDVVIAGTYARRLERHTEPFGNKRSATLRK